MMLWLLGVALAADPPPPPLPATLEIGEALRGLEIELPTPVLDALRARNWALAGAGLRGLGPDKWTGNQKGSWAFLVAWCAVHADVGATAADVLPLLDDAPAVPDAYLELIRGEVLLSTGQPLEAIAHLDKVATTSVIYPRAALKAGEALRGLTRTAEGWARVEQVAARPDPASGNAEALLLLAERAGVASEDAAPLLRRIWTHYPGSEPETRAAELLANHHASRPPTWEQRTIRAERWMDQSSWSRALTETDAIAAKASGTSVDACRLRFVRGRSQYKKNAITEASTTLADIGRSCVAAEGDYGPRGLYLLGTALSRRKLYAQSAAAWAQVPELYPDHSMADDGLVRGGVALLEAGQPAEARERWDEAMARYPAGDSVPEAVFRAAFSAYKAGDTPGAIELAERVGALPLDGDALHVQAGRYWAARWQLYGDAAAPNTASSRPEARAVAVAGWRALCEQLPHSFYAILAYARLVEVAPDVAKVLAGRPEGHVDGSARAPWTVRVDRTRDPAIRSGVGLMRLGLAQEALAEWRSADTSDLTPDEKAWTIELRIAAGDWLLAHDDMRRWLTSHPVGTLGPHQPQIVRLAYPDRYWTEVKASVLAGYRYEPRLFHALSREESNFNRTIVSHAGARGLSQLMPATAMQTAGWLELKITMRDLDDPQTNLNIGAKYLDAMHKQLAGSPYLSLAAYNGGAGNVNKWITAQNNPPTDEFVEQIPFDETRGYVSRVMGTWQTMRFQFDQDLPAFPDLSRFNHQAKPATP